MKFTRENMEIFENREKMAIISDVIINEEFSYNIIFNLHF